MPLTGFHILIHKSLLALANLFLLSFVNKCAGYQLILVTHFVWPLKIFINLPYIVYTFTKLSIPPVAKYSFNGSNAHVITQFLCSDNVHIGVSVYKSQSLIVLSPLQLATFLESALNYTHNTLSLCP